MSERDEFEACPFCGCTDSPVQRGNGIGDVWLECAQCEASTRLRANIETCAKDWNRRASQAVPALTDEAAMRVALRIMANLEDRKGVLDGVDDDTKADIADEIAVAILAAPQPSPEPKEPR